MYTQNNPQIICIEDQKEEPNPKTNITQTVPLNDPPSQPTNFNPKTFPFLASMLRKMTTVTPKPETIVTLPQHSINSAIATHIQAIKPLPMEGRKEVQEVTRIRPAQRLFQVVEDVDGVANPSVLAQGSKKEKKYLIQQQVEIKAKQIAIESIVNEVNSIQVQGELEKPKDYQLQVTESCETSNYGVNNPNIQSRAANVEAPEEVVQSRKQYKVTSDISPKKNPEAVNTKNISDLIFQFSQKIAEYVDKGHQASQDNRMDEQKQLEAVSQFSLEVEKASPQAEELLSAMIAPRIEEEVKQNSREQLQSVDQQQRRYQAIEANILLGCRNGIQDKSEQRMQQNEQALLNYTQNGQLKSIQPAVEPIDIQQPINEVPNLGMKEQLGLHQAKIDNHSEPQLIMNNRQVAHQIFAVVEQVTQQDQTQNKDQSEKALQKINQNAQNLQKNVQRLNNNTTVTQNIPPQQHTLTTLQMLSEGELNELKSRVAKMIPDFAQKINDITNQQLIEIYYMIKKQLNVDLMLQTPQTSYHIAEGIQKQKQEGKVAAQQKTNHHLQKQAQEAPTLQVIQPMAAPQQTSTHMDSEKGEDMIEEESKAIRQLQQMKHLGEEQLRKQISSMNPAWREEVIKMNYAELQSMLDQTLAELHKSAARKQQSQQPHPPHPSQQQGIHYQNIQTATLQAIQIKTSIIQPATIETAPLIVTQMAMQHQNQKTVSSGVKEIRSILINKAPDMEQKVNSLSDARVSEIYHSHTPKAEGEESKGKQKAETIEISDTQKDKPTIDYIMKYCTGQFPQLAQDLKQLKEHQIRDIYEQLLLKIGPSISSNRSKAVVKDSNSDKKAPNKEKQNKVYQHSEKSAKSAEKNDHSLKRAHQTMVATNPRKAETQKIEKKKLSPLEIRNILITKLPQLKANIMMLDDNEIQRIFYESIQNGGNSQPNNQPTTHTASNKPDTKPLQVVKPVIVLPEKKVAIDTPAPKAQPVVPMTKHNIQVIENTDVSRNKKMRTVILIQTEAELHEGEVLSKATMTENGFKKKCSCDCCRKLDLNELLMRLGELLEERK